MCSAGRDRGRCAVQAGIVAGVQHRPGSRQVYSVGRDRDRCAAQAGIRAGVQRRLYIEDNKGWKLLESMGDSAVLQDLCTAMEKFQNWSRVTVTLQNTESML